MSKYTNELKGFPESVINWIEEKQVEQGNPPDASILDNHLIAGKSQRGFDWGKTNPKIEGPTFCFRVLKLREFHLVDPNEDKGDIELGETLDSVVKEGITKVLSDSIDTHKIIFTQLDEGMDLIWAEDDWNPMDGTIMYEVIMKSKHLFLIRPTKKHESRFIFNSIKNAERFVDEFALPAMEILSF